MYLINKKMSHYVSIFVFVGLFCRFVCIDLMNVSNAAKIRASRKAVPSPMKTEAIVENPKVRSGATLLQLFGTLGFQRLHDPSKKPFSSNFLMLKICICSEKLEYSSFKVIQLHLLIIKEGHVSIVFLSH